MCSKIILLLGGRTTTTKCVKILTVDAVPAVNSDQPSISAQTNADGIDNGILPPMPNTSDVQETLNNATAALWQCMQILYDCPVNLHNAVGR